jgi:hypothetical protein
VIDEKLGVIFEAHKIDNFASALNVLHEFGGYDQVEAFANASHFFPFEDFNCDLITIGHNTDDDGMMMGKPTVGFHVKKDIKEIQGLLKYLDGTFTDGMKSVYKTTHIKIGEIPHLGVVTDYIIEALKEKGVKQIHVENSVYSSNGIIDGNVRPTLRVSNDNRILVRATPIFDID